MVRPKKIRNIRFMPEATYFKPRGIPLQSLDEVSLSHDEMEAIRLKYIKNFGQIECAKEMKISQSTFQRILISANQKIAEGLVNGKAIRIEK